MLLSSQYRKFSMLINVKMPTNVGILTFVSMINTTSNLKARKVLSFQHLSFYEQLKFDNFENIFITSGQGNS